MTTTQLRVLLSALLLPAAALAQDGGVWRCGNSYSATPCAGGRVLEPLLPRPQEDVQAARSAAEREQQLARQMVQERHREEAAAAAAARLDALRALRLTKSPAPAKKAPRPRPDRALADADTWRAVVPASRRKKG